MFDGQLDRAILEFPRAELGAKLFPRPLPPLRRFGRRCIRREGRIAVFLEQLSVGRGEQQLEQTLLHALVAWLFDLGSLSVADEVGRRLDEIADNAFDIAAIIADLRVPRRLHFDEGCAHQAGQSPGDLGFADACGTDHDDVFRRDLLADLFRKLLPTPPVA